MKLSFLDNVFSIKDATSEGLLIEAFGNDMFIPYSVLNESKSEAPLYRVLGANGCISAIKKNMFDRRASYGICFTRNKNYWIGDLDHVAPGEKLFQFRLNQYKLASDYKIIPIAESGYQPKNNRSEYEERILGDVKNINRYIECIDTRKGYVEKWLKKLDNAVRKYNGSVLDNKDKLIRPITLNQETFTLLSPFFEDYDTKKYIEAIMVILTSGYSIGPFFHKALEDCKIIKNIPKLFTVPAVVSNFKELEQKVKEIQDKVPEQPKAEDSQESPINIAFKENIEGLKSRIREELKPKGFSIYKVTELNYTIVNYVDYEYGLKKHNVELLSLLTPTELVTSINGVPALERKQVISYLSKYYTVFSKGSAIVINEPIDVNNLQDDVVNRLQVLQSTVENYQPFFHTLLTDKGFKYAKAKAVYTLKLPKFTVTVDISDGFELLIKFKKSQLDELKPKEVRDFFRRLRIEFDINDVTATQYRTFKMPIDPKSWEELIELINELNTLLEKIEKNQGSDEVNYIKGLLIKHGFQSYDDYFKMKSNNLAFYVTINVSSFALAFDVEALNYQDIFTQPGIDTLPFFKVMSPGNQKHRATFSMPYYKDVMDDIIQSIVDAINDLKVKEATLSASCPDHDYLTEILGFTVDKTSDSSVQYIKNVKGTNIKYVYNFGTGSIKVKLPADAFLVQNKAFLASNSMLNVNGTQIVIIPPSFDEFREIFRKFKEVVEQNEKNKNASSFKDAIAELLQVSGFTKSVVGYNKKVGNVDVVVMLGQQVSMLIDVSQCKDKENAKMHFKQLENFAEISMADGGLIANLQVNVNHVMKAIKVIDNFDENKSSKSSENKIHDSLKASGFNVAIHTAIRNGKMMILCVDLDYPQLEEGKYAIDINFIENEDLEDKVAKVKAVCKGLVEVWHIVDRGILVTCTTSNLSELVSQLIFLDDTYSSLAKKQAMSVNKNQVLSVLDEYNFEITKQTDKFVRAKSVVNGIPCECLVKFSPDSYHYQLKFNQGLKVAEELKALFSNVKDVIVEKMTLDFYAKCTSLNIFQDLLDILVKFKPVKKPKDTMPMEDIIKYLQDEGYSPLTGKDFSSLTIVSMALSLPLLSIEFLIPTDEQDEEISAFIEFTDKVLGRSKDQVYSAFSYFDALAKVYDTENYDQGFEFHITKSLNDIKKVVDTSKAFNTSFSKTASTTAKAKEVDDEELEDNVAYLLDLEGIPYKDAKSKYKISQIGQVPLDGVLYKDGTYFRFSFDKNIPGLDLLLKNLKSIPTSEVHTMIDTMAVTVDNIDDCADLIDFVRKFRYAHVDELPKDTKPENEVINPIHQWLQDKGFSSDFVEGKFIKDIKCMSIYVEPLEGNRYSILANFAVSDTDVPKLVDLCHPLLSIYKGEVWASGIDFVIEAYLDDVKRIVLALMDIDSDMLKWLQSDQADITNRDVDKKPNEGQPKEVIPTAGVPNLKANTRQDIPTKIRKGDLINRVFDLKFKKTGEEDHDDAIDRILAYIKKNQAVLKTRNDLGIWLLDSPKELAKYKLEFPAVLLLFYGEINAQGVKDDPIYKKFWKCKALSVVRHPFKTKDLNGNPCMGAAFYDAKTVSKYKIGLIKEALENNISIEINGNTFDVLSLNESIVELQSSSGIILTIDIDSIDI